MANMQLNSRRSQQKRLRERVMYWHRLGHDNRAIAATLGVSLMTVTKFVTLNTKKKRKLIPYAGKPRKY